MPLHLPTYPATMWESMQLGTSSVQFCFHCGYGYNDHGAPEEVAKRFNIPNEKRHLICQYKRGEKEARADRGELYIEVKCYSEADDGLIGVSETDEDMGPLLLQLSQNGAPPFRCIYLSEEGARALHDALGQFLAAKPSF